MPTKVVMAYSGGLDTSLATFCWVRKHLAHRLSRFSSPFIIIVAG